MAPPMRFSRPASKEPEGLETPSNNLWVGNLSPDVSDSDLMDLFANYGALDSVTSYSARSYAFVYFKRVEDATAAKDALQGAEVRGSSIKIEFARPAKPSKNLWVGGISAAVSKEHLEEEFLKFGKIEDFKFLRERNTAFVEYYKLEDASQAMKNMNGKRIGGEQIRVDFLRSQSLRRDQSADFRDSRESQFPAMHSGVKRAQNSQPPGGRKDGPPSNVLWVGYPPSVQIDETMLHNAMILFGEIERIKSFPSRHYSFVEFRSVDEARRAKEGLQGRLLNDPRITIMFSSSGQAKDHPNFYAGIKGPRPEMFNEPLYGPGQMDILEHPHPGGMTNFARPPLGVQVRPFGANFDLPGAEFNDLGPNWRRPSSPAPGILPSPASRVRPAMRSISSGWDVLDGNQHQRESKRTRIDASSSLDDDSFPSRRADHHGLGLERPYGLDGGVVAPFPGKHSLSPVGGRSRIGGPYESQVDDDYLWRGIIAKGGTPVCHARCVPIGKGIESDLPEVVNCSARTGLDMLAKHYAEAIGFDIVFFLPDSEDDFASYTEFLRYLGSKNRAGVAKFDDGTTLFLVPPSDFLTKVLKVNGPERLYGVVLKLPQVAPPVASMQPQLPTPIPGQYTDRRQIHPPEADFHQIPPKEEHVIPMDYGKVLQEEPKIPPKPLYPSTTEAIAVSQDHVPNNANVVSRAGVSLTPELIATLASILPATGQLASESVQPASASSNMRPSFPSVTPDKASSLQGWNYDNQVSGNTSYLPLGNLSSQAQIQPQFQSYPPSHSANLLPGSTHLPDSISNLSQQSAALPRPPSSYPMPSQGGQIPLSTQGYGVGHGADVSGAYSPSIMQQPSNPSALSGLAQNANYPQAQPGMPSSADKANWELSNQVQQYQTALSGTGQGVPEAEVDKNQRYQSTLQFAANLLLQIQQQQQQTGTPAAQGTGNQQ